MFAKKGSKYYVYHGLSESDLLDNNKNYVMSAWYIDSPYHTEETGERDDNGKKLKHGWYYTDSYQRLPKHLSNKFYDADEVD